MLPIRSQLLFDVCSARYGVTTTGDNAPLKRRGGLATLLGIRDNFSLGQLLSTNRFIEGRSAILHDDGFSLVCWRA